MKVALCQLNYKVADFSSNTEKIISAIEKNKKLGARLAVFSEMAVCGYPPFDLLENKDFIDKCYESLNQIAAACKGIYAIVGSPTLNTDEKGKRLFNSAVLLYDGKILDCFHKTLLPTYDVFDEYRYFEPNSNFKIAEIEGEKVAITICEDLWDNQPVENAFARTKLYRVSPLEQLAAYSPELVINIAASPFSYRQTDNRMHVLLDNAVRYKLPVIYVNQVGANTDLIFDGGSLVINNTGNLVKQVPYFSEQTVIVDTDDLSKVQPAVQMSDIQRIHDALVLGIRDYFGKTGFKKAVLGLSGGIDSAVTLALAAEALKPENTYALLMPSRYSSEHYVTDAVDLAENLGVAYSIVSIEDAFGSIEQSLSGLFIGKSPDLTEENIQARIRGLFLMAFTNKFGHILLNTSNKSEAATGYGTLYGDMNGGLSVLGDVYKTQVYDLARYINRNGELIPENTIQKPPSAELRENQKDSDSLPDYPVLDAILRSYIELKMSVSEIEAQGFDKVLVEKVIRLVNMNEYKRFQAPPVLRISPKSFGFGRRMPLVAKY